MKKLVNLKGVKTLDKSQQKSIFGGGFGSDTIGGGQSGPAFFICNDGSEGWAASCDEQATVACSYSGGLRICVGEPY